MPYVTMVTLKWYTQYILIEGAVMVVQSMPITTNSWGEVYSMQPYMIKFVSDFSPGTLVSPNNKTDRHDITEI